MTVSATTDTLFGVQDLRRIVCEKAPDIGQALALDVRERLDRLEAVRLQITAAQTKIARCRSDVHVARADLEAIKADVGRGAVSGGDAGPRYAVLKKRLEEVQGQLRAVCQARDALEVEEREILSELRRSRAKITATERRIDRIVSSATNPISRDAPSAPLAAVFDLDVEAMMIAFLAHHGSRGGADPWPEGDRDAGPDDDGAPQVDPVGRFFRFMASFFRDPTQADKNAIRDRCRARLIEGDGPAALLPIPAERPQEAPETRGSICQ